MPPITAGMKTKFMGMYRGQVFSNTDPLKQGRIKVQIWPMMSEIIDPELLPWAVPAMPLWGGAGSGFGMMAIPAIGTHVFVFFEAGDVYQPVYFAEAQNAVAGIPAEVVTDYPFTRVMKSPSGVKIVVDDMDGSILIETPLHSGVLIDGTGKITLSSVVGMDLVAVVNIVMNAGDLISLTAVGKVQITAGGDVEVNTTGKATITTAGNTEVNATGDCVVHAIGNVEAKSIGGNVDVEGQTVTIKGNTSVIIQGTMAVNIN